MAIQCVIIDDEPLAIQVLQQHVEQVTDLEVVATFQNPMEAMTFLKETQVDLLFLDIQMPLLTGIDFLKSTHIKPKVIFTTAYRNYALESYELDVIDYLLKPISFSRFFKAINKYRSLTGSTLQPTTPTQENVLNDHLYVNSNKKHIKIEFSSILYVESLKDYIRIHTTAQAITTKDKISSFLEKLPAHFIQTHRSYIVNSDQITAFTAKDVEIGDLEIPIGEVFKEKVLMTLKNEGHNF